MSKEKILITGAGPNGVTGKLIKESLCEEYELLTPRSTELDLTDDSAVRIFFEQNHIDYIIHCATFRPNSNFAHKVDEELESNLRMYFALASQCDKVKKMIYFGSGAEFNKSNDIHKVREVDFGQSIPSNKYGLAKYIMMKHCATSSNIINLRLFGTINCYERPNKNVVSNICLKAANGLPIELKQDCRFSFVDMSDVLLVIKYVLTHENNYRDYNLVMNDSCLLSDVVKTVISVSGKELSYSFKEDSLNLEYTANNDRIVEETGIKFSSIQTAVERVYNYILSHKTEFDITEVDNRWLKQNNMERKQYITTEIAGGGKSLIMNKLAA